MDSRVSGWGLLAAGMIVAGGSAFLLVTSADGGTAAASPLPVATAPSTTTPPAATPGRAARTITPTDAPPATPSPTTTPLPTATPVPTLADAVRAFVPRLVEALRTGDAAFQVARLHPETLARYGEDQCLAELPRRQDATVSITIRSIGSPEPWDYTTDGLTTVVDEAIPVEADVVVQGESSRQVLHVAIGPDGTVLWFTDCGNPSSSPAP